MAHLVGILGMALIVLSMAYSLRKRKWIVRFGRMTRWLSLHHWIGFIGGSMALVHTLGNMTGLGFLLIAVLLLVLASSGIYFLERGSRRPLTEAMAELDEARKERTRLDSEYRTLYSRGMAATPQGIDVYNRLMAAHQEVLDREQLVAQLRQEGTSWTWWRNLHNVGTMMLVGVVIVHVWSKLYFAGGGL